jgi:taurine dioxygenase
LNRSRGPALEADETRSLPEIGGIEITGIDLSAPLSEERKDWLMRTFRAHPVIVFRDQHLTREQQYEFTLMFGEIEGAHVGRLTDAVKYTPVHTVSNIGPDGMPSAPVRERGNYYWHTDKSYHDVPSLLTMLHGVEIPSKGAAKRSSPTPRWLMRRLDEATKQRLTGLRAQHSWERSRIQSHSQLASEDQKRERPPVDHPIVRTHPDTGVKALYLGNHSSHVLGWPEDRRDMRCCDGWNRSRREPTSCIRTVGGRETSFCGTTDARCIAHCLTWT